MSRVYLMLSVVAAYAVLTYGAWHFLRYAA